MLSIRLQRKGRKNDPSFHIIVIESTEGPKSGKVIEKLGTYDSIRKTKTFNEERIKHWVSHGAKPTDTMHNILVSNGILNDKKRNVLPLKKPIEKKEEVAAKAPEVKGTDGESTDDPAPATKETAVPEIESKETSSTPETEPTNEATPESSSDIPESKPDDSPDDNADNKEN